MQLKTIARSASGGEDSHPGESDRVAPENEMISGTSEASYGPSAKGDSQISKVHSHSPLRSG